MRGEQVMEGAPLVRMVTPPPGVCVQVGEAMEGALLFRVVRPKSDGDTPSSSPQGGDPQVSVPGLEG